MIKLAIRVVFAVALAGFSTSALVGPAFAEDKKDDKAQKADKANKKKKSEKKDEEKSGW
ncbi:MAG TPA: hypothetical protein VMU50_18680 [Polyangia bacterium]|nr:hypothetical protein [Polyangia bacterium]